MIHPSSDGQPLVHPEVGGVERVAIDPLVQAAYEKAMQRAIREGGRLMTRRLKAGPAFHVVDEADPAARDAALQRLAKALVRLFDEEA